MAFLHKILLVHLLKLFLELGYFRQSKNLKQLTL